MGIVGSAESSFQGTIKNFPKMPHTGQGANDTSESPPDTAKKEKPTTERPPKKMENSMLSSRVVSPLIGGVKAIIKDFAFSILNLSKSRGYHLVRDLKFYSNNYDKDIIIFDIGANVGQTAAKMRRFFPKAEICSFEPSKGTYSLLKKNTRNLNIQCFNFGFGSETGEKKLFLYEHSGLNSVLLGGRSPIAVEDIEIYTVNKFFKQRNFSDLFLLKTDAEGYDIEILLGSNELLGQKKIKFVMCEVQFEIAGSDPHTKFSIVQNYLNQFDYHLCGIYDICSVGDAEEHIGFANALFSCRA